MALFRAAILFFLFATTGCAPSANEAVQSQSLTSETATTPTAPTFPSPDTAPQPTATTDARGGGQLVVLDTPPADRDELLAAYADAIGDQPFKFGDVGAVLEALAVESIQRIYPEPAHEVVSGIEYADETGRTLGELDVVVFLTASGDAVMVAEVKLSKNLERAASKADSQLRRFRTAITEGRVARIQRKGKGATYRAANFENVLRYGKIGSRGALEHGFDWEIDLTREEGDQLQKLMRAQPVH